MGKAAGAAFKARAAFHAEELKEALAGPHGAVVSKTIVALGAMNINNAGALVAAVEQIDWTDVSAKTPGGPSTSSERGHHRIAREARPAAVR